MNYICTKCGSLQEKPDVFPKSKIFPILIFAFIISLLVDTNLWVHYTGVILLIFVIITYVVHKNYCSACTCNNCVIPINSSKGQKLYETHINTSK